MNFMISEKWQENRGETNKLCKDRELFSFFIILDESSHSRGGGAYRQNIYPSRNALELYNFEQIASQVRFWLSSCFLILPNINDFKIQTYFSPYKIEAGSI